MATKKKAFKRTEPKAKVNKQIPYVMPPNLEPKASENGTNIREYAQRLLDAQSVEASKSFVLMKVENGLLGQKYEVSDIRVVIQEMQEELMGA